MILIRKRFILEALILVLSPNIVIAQTEKEAFAKRALVAVTKDQPQRKCYIADDNALIVCGDVRFGLENVRRVILSSNLPDTSIDQFISTYYGTALAEAYDGAKAPNESSSEDDMEKAKSGSVDAPELPVVDRLYPQIVPSSYQEELGASNVSDFLPGLMIAYSIDEADRYAFVLDRHYEDWSLSRDDVKDYAYKNLAKKALQTNIGLDESSVGDESSSNWLSISVKDGFAAARILLPEVRQRIAHHLGGSFYVAMPNRDFLIAWSLDFANHLDFMDAVRQDFETRPHPLSPNLYVASKEKIRPATTAELLPNHLMKFE